MTRWMILVLAVLAIGAGANGVVLTQYEFEGGWTNSVPGAMAITPLGGAALAVDAGKGNVADIQSSTSWLQVGSESALNPISSQITMAAWIRTSDAYTGLQRILGRGYAWYMNMSDSIATVGQITITVRDSAVSATTIQTTGTAKVNDGLWHHVAATWNTATGATCIYVDGVLDGSSIHTATSISNTTSYLYAIGGRATAIDAGVQFFRGWMDSVRVYNDALSQAEVQALYNGTVPAAPTKATLPRPGNNAADVSINATLAWRPGVGAKSHDVYLGTVSTDVSNAQRLLGDINRNGVVDINDVSLLTEYWLADPAGSVPYAGINDDDTVDATDYTLLAQDWKNSAGPIFKGNQDANSFVPGTLALSSTYYWRVDEVNGPNTVKGDVWSFTTQSDKASKPSPASGALGVTINPTLSWSAGYGALSHDVYFGTVSPGTFRGNQPGTTYTPAGPLANAIPYYWRIDEVGPSGTITGDVWNFTTAGFATMRKGPYLIYPGNNTQMTVLWQTDVTVGSSIAWGTDTSYSTGSASTIPT